MVYTCCSWQDELDGTLLLDKCKIFLGSYQETLAELGVLPGLSKLERQYMPIMIAAANIYLINWTVSTYYKEENLNVYEYLAYMQHNVRLMKWIDGHKEELSDMAKGV
jgi:homoserine kinase type II